MERVVNWGVLVHLHDGRMFNATVERGELHSVFVRQRGKMAKPTLRRGRGGDGFARSRPATYSRRADSSWKFIQGFLEGGFIDFSV